VGWQHPEPRFDAGDTRLLDGATNNAGPAFGGSSWTAMTSAPVDQLTERLQQLLEVAADDRARQYWERYLKGTARFRGVPMAAIRTAVRTLWHTEQLSGWPTSQLLALAEHWFGQPLSEDKLAGTLLIAEQLAGRLTLEDGDALARPPAGGKLADWSSCDWYATKALHAYLTANSQQLPARAELVAGWSTAANLWQRRAAVVAFVKLAPQVPPPFPGLVDLLLAACANNLVSSDRFAHTGPGWLLRELSRSHPDQVARFVDAHPELSAEAAQMATARLRPGPYRRR
jgi:3-methyladenine DNA glycosylase AlkD